MLIWILQWSLFLKHHHTCQEVWRFLEGRQYSNKTTYGYKNILFTASPLKSESENTVDEPYNI